MINSIWSDIYQKLSELIEPINKFLTENYSNPFLWIGLVIIILVVTSYAISKLANK